jgi:hypothetical protein
MSEGRAPSVRVFRIARLTSKAGLIAVVAASFVIALLLLAALLSPTAAVTGRGGVVAAFRSPASPAASADFQVVNLTANNTTVDVTMAFNISVDVVNLTGGAINATNYTGYAFTWSGLPAFVPGEPGTGCVGVNPYNYSVGDNNDSSLLNCTAASSGTLTVSVSVENTTSLQSNSSTTLTIVVNPFPTLTSFRVSEQNSTLGTQIWFNATGSGGTTPLTYTYTGLPLGCTGSTDSFACTPTRAGLYNVTVMVVDTYGYTSTALSEKVTVSSSKTTSPGIGTTGWAIVIGIVVVGALITIALLFQARREERAGRMVHEEGPSEPSQESGGTPPMGGTPPSPPGPPS